VPGVAVSLNSPDGHSGVLDFAPAGQVACSVAAQVIERGLPEGVLLNVNVPYLPVDQIKGYMITRQGLRVYRDALDRRLDPRSRPYYWIGGEAPTGVIEDGTDYGALEAGFVSITPLHLDLTAHQAMAGLRSWQF
jgi:5'-nucleotidase